MPDNYTHKRQQWLKQRRTTAAKRITGDALAIALGVLLILLALDVLGLMLWVLSGQTPPGDVFAGAITKSIINTIIN